MSSISLQIVGSRNTKGRSEVLKVLKNEDTPVDVAHILDHLRDQKLSINQATVYRILDFFEKQGLINRFEFHEGKFRYEIAKGDHHHLICKKCEWIEDISDCNIEALEKEIEKKKGFKVSSHSLEFFGLCQDCQR